MNDFVNYEQSFEMDESINQNNQMNFDESSHFYEDSEYNKDRSQQQENQNKNNVPRYLNNNISPSEINLHKTSNSKAYTTKSDIEPNKNVSNNSPIRLNESTPNVLRNNDDSKYQKKKIYQKLLKIKKARKRRLQMF